jgi:hypothetical protein
VSHYRSDSYLNWLNALPLFGRGPLSISKALMGLLRETRGLLLPSVMSGGAFLCFQFQSNASRNSALNTEWSTSTDLILILALVTFFFCDTACSTAFEIFTQRLIAPYWHRARERCRASAASSPGASRSLKQWLCSPSRNEKNTRPFRSVHISHNPPPLVPSFST